jgi:hypothetical protein
MKAASFGGGEYPPLPTTLRGETFRTKAAFTFQATAQMMTKRQESQGARRSSMFSGTNERVMQRLMVAVVTCGALSAVARDGWGQEVERAVAVREQAATVGE